MCKKDAESTRRSHVEKLAFELASTVRALAACADENWCESVLVSGGFCEGESVEKGAIALYTCRAAISGELVRVDLHLLSDMSNRLNLGNLLVREIEPFIIGVGQIRVAWHEPFESLVVLRRNPSLVARDHAITPEMIEALITPTMRQNGALRLGELDEASAAYQAKEAFLAMIVVGIREGVFQVAER